MVLVGEQTRISFDTSSDVKPKIAWVLVRPHPSTGSGEYVKRRLLIPDARNFLIYFLLLHHRNEIASHFLWLLWSHVRDILHPIPPDPPNSRAANNLFDVSLAISDKYRQGRTNLWVCCSPGHVSNLLNNFITIQQI